MTQVVTAQMLERISKILRSCEAKLSQEVGYQVTVSYEATPFKAATLNEVYHQVKLVVCEYFGINMKGLQGSSRRTACVWGRYIAIKIMSDVQKISLKTLGEHFGGRDHSTIIHALEKFNELLEDKEAFRTAYEKIHQTLKPVLK